MPEYTAAVVVAVVLVVLLEVAWLRTGLLRRLSYWLTMVAVLAFQVPVDGWLTKLSAPVVVYDPEHVTGWRGPWDIPVEDFAFGFGLLTLVLLLWERAGGAREAHGRGATR